MMNNIHAGIMLSLTVCFSFRCSTLDLHNSRSPGPSRSAPHRHAKYRNANYSSSSQEDEYDLFTTPIVMTQGHKVKSSLKKLRQQHDEIFEL